MNASEKAAWRSLIEIGATTTTIGGQPALDLRTVNVRSKRRLNQFMSSFLEVAGRSGTVRRHIDRDGYPVFVVRDA